MPKKEIVLNKMFGKPLVPVAPPFPFVNLAGVKTVSDFRAAADAVKVKAEELRVARGVPAKPKKPKKPKS